MELGSPFSLPQRRAPRCGIIPTLTANPYEKDRKPLCTQADAVFLF